MTKIKICGMQSIFDIEAANSVKPDYIGFIFVPGMKRTVDIDFAKTLKSKLSPDIRAVGVFRNAAIEDVMQAVKKETVDLIQLHGDESNEYIKDLRNALTDEQAIPISNGVEIIKAFTVRSEDDLEQARNSYADYVLLDNGYGTGERFDWNKLEGFDREYFLAGGLNPDNVTEAVAGFSPYGVDVSSGVEVDKPLYSRNAANKDVVRMEKFIKQVRMKG